MRKNIKVSVLKIKNIDYYEYFFTGFYNLYANDFIQEFNYNLRDLENPEKDWLVSELKFQFKDKVIHVAIDIRDTPWEFDEQILNTCDIYFKCQCPIDYKQGYYRLNDSTKIEFSNIVKNNITKIRPLIMGRPLSRSMNFNINNKLLKEYSDIRIENKRENDLLAYFGVCYDHFGYPENHPHIKRTKLLLYLNSKNNNKMRLIYRPPLEKELIKVLPRGYEHLPSRGHNVTDKEYRDLCKNTKATLNIAGLRGSIPFRFMDAYLTGMIILTDTPLVKWYVPLEDEKEIFIIGNMGYEILTENDYNPVYKNISNRIQNINFIRNQVIEYQNNFYENYLKPVKIAEYIIHECEKLL